MDERLASFWGSFLAGAMLVSGSVPRFCFSWTESPKVQPWRWLGRTPTSGGSCTKRSQELTDRHPKPTSDREWDKTYSDGNEPGESWFRILSHYIIDLRNIFHFVDCFLILFDSFNFLDFLFKILHFLTLVFNLCVNSVWKGHQRYREVPHYPGKILV